MQQSPGHSAATVVTQPASSRRWALVALGLVLILVTVIRLRLAPCPLERDEGEYAFIGQLMLQGIPPYTEAANLKFPGTYASYAIIEAVFGQTSRGIHHGLLIVNLATILLVYHLGLRFLEFRRLFRAGRYRPHFCGTPVELETRFCPRRRGDRVCLYGEAVRVLFRAVRLPAPAL
jgi:hypothetical protein